MYFHFLVEDQSGAALIEILMEKLIIDVQKNQFKCTHFHGIGGFTRKNTVKETRTGKLLNDLTTYLKGFNNSLKNIRSAVFIILDNDDRNTEQFRKELEDVVSNNFIFIDHVFCIAVEEIEAWLLGDSDAVKQAYPAVKTNVLNSYRQDSICGTWEILADAIYPGGISKFRKDHSSYMEIGEEKTRWAKSIGAHMDIDKNVSPSFNYFINEICNRLE